MKLLICLFFYLLMMVVAITGGVLFLTGSRELGSGLLQLATSVTLLMVIVENMNLTKELKKLKK